MIHYCPMCLRGHDLSRYMDDEIIHCKCDTLLRVRHMGGARSELIIANLDEDDDEGDDDG